MRLADIDRDDAIAEALDALHGTTRAGFFRRAALGSAALLSAAAESGSARCPAGSPSRRRSSPPMSART